MSRLPVDRGFIQSLKLWLNLCSFYVKPMLDEIETKTLNKDGKGNQ